MFGAAAVVFGLIMLLVAMLIVGGMSLNLDAFVNFIVNVFLPILFITLGLIALMVGLLLLVYG